MLRVKLLFVVALIMIMPTGTVRAQSTSDLAVRTTALQQQIDAGYEKIRELNRTEDDLQTKIEQINLELDQANREIELTNLKIDEIDGKLETTQKELKRQLDRAIHLVSTSPIRLTYSA